MIIVCIGFLLVGCQAIEEIPEGYYDYPRDDVEAAIATLSFDPNIPQFVPFPVEFIVSDRYHLTGTDQEAMDISFYSRQNDLLIYQVVDGETDQLINGEAVEIDSSITGAYADNDFAKTLLWKEDGLTYLLIFRSGIFDTEEITTQVTKSDLIKVAQSFHS